MVVYHNSSIQIHITNINQIFMLRATATKCDRHGCVYLLFHLWSDWEARTLHQLTAPLFYKNELGLKLISSISAIRCNLLGLLSSAIITEPLKPCLPPHYPPVNSNYIPRATSLVIPYQPY